MAEYSSDIRHVAGKKNVVADCLSRPPEVLSLPRSTKVAVVKVPSGSLAGGCPCGTGWESRGLYCGCGNTWTCPVLAHAQEGCYETQELHVKLTAKDALISGHKIWCENPGVC